MITNAYNTARAFAKQSPGMTAFNYATRADYSRDYRRASKDLQPCLRLIDFAEGQGKSIEGRTGRITLTHDICDYVTGQYFATEYRRALRAHIEQKLRFHGYSDDIIKQVASKR